MSPRQFIHAAGWGDHMPSPAMRMDRRYKVFIYYSKGDGGIEERRSVNSFDDIELARAEVKDAWRDGLEVDGVKIESDRIVQVVIKERVVDDEERSG